MADPLATYQAAPFASPFSLQCNLLDGLSGSAEGLWVPTQFCKSGSVELFGSATGISVTLLGTNALGIPMNTWTATVANSISARDQVAVKVTNENIKGGAATVTYTAVAGDTTTTMAAALAALLASSPALQGIGLLATSIAAVITLSFPSVFQGAGAGGQYPGNLANVTTFSATSTGSETVTFAGSTAIGVAIGSAITAVGVSALGAIPRFMRARAITVTGGTLSANFNGAG